MGINIPRPRYFPLAGLTAEKMAEDNKPFVYTSHPWLLERYFTCPCPAPADGTDGANPDSVNNPGVCNLNSLATSLNNSFEPPLICPNATELANVTRWLEKKQIRYNALPFNVQPENMSPELLYHGVFLARGLDAKFVGG